MNEENYFFFGFGIFYYIILILCGTVWAIEINLILGLIMILFGIFGIVYWISFLFYDQFDDLIDTEICYWMIIAPLVWVITANAIFYGFGWTVDDYFVHYDKNIEVIMTSWLISSFFWYVIPILGITFARNGDKIKSYPKLFYFLLFAPTGFLITSNIILFSLGYNLSNFEVYLPIWGISVLIWFLIPTVIITLRHRYKNKRFLGDHKIIKYLVYIGLLFLIFFSTIYCIILIGKVVSSIDSYLLSLLLLEIVLFLIGLIGLSIICIRILNEKKKFKRDIKNIFGIIIIILMVIGIGLDLIFYDPEYWFELGNNIFLIGFFFLFGWYIWFVISLLRKKENLINLIYLVGVVLFLIAIILALILPPFSTVSMGIAWSSIYFWIIWFIYDISFLRLDLAEWGKKPVTKQRKLESRDQKEKVKTLKKQEKIKAREIEANRFENLIKKSESFLKKGKSLVSKESYEAAVDNWVKAIDFYSRALKKAPSPDRANLINLRKGIFNLYLKFISINCLITKGASLTFQDNKIITKPSLGLNVFLAKWLESRGDE